MGEFEKADEDFQKAKELGAAGKDDTLEELLKSEMDFLRRFPRIFKSRENRRARRKKKRDDVS